jgi:hypothetical protein
MITTPIDDEDLRLKPMAGLSSIGYDSSSNS